MNQAVNIEVQTINHLGIIAGIIDEIGIVEIINEQLGIKQGYFILKMFKMRSRPYLHFRSA